MAYARGGSSYLGEVLSVGKRSTYFFEPMYHYRYYYGWDKYDDTHFSTKDLNDIQNYIERIFNCDYWVNPVNKVVAMRKNCKKKQCLASDVVVVKTVRLGFRNLMPWIKDSDIKIVHLLRDPRGAVNSRNKHKDFTHYKVEDFCQEITDDLSLGNILPHDRYYVVKYEDVVDQPEETLGKVFEFMGFSGLTEDARTYLDDHKKGTRNKAFYSTFRNKSFKHDQWKSDLDIQKIQEIESKCSSLMNKLEYAPYVPQK